MNHDRSPAAEAMFKNSKKYEAKSAGLDLAATKQISIDDVKWADIIFVMDERNDGHKSQLIDEFTELIKSKDVRVLGIPNYYRRYDPELYRLLRVRLEKEGIDVEETNYEDFINGLEDKKQMEILEGEKVEKKKTKERHYCEFSPDGLISYIVTDVPKKEKKLEKEEKKDGKILEGEKTFAEWNKLVKSTGESDNSSEKGGSFGRGKTYMSKYVAEILYKGFNKTPEEKAKEKEEEAKRKKIRENNRRGWVK